MIAHIRSSDGNTQTVQSHLELVALLSKQYGASLGIEALCELAGFLHDMGKFTEEFTRYLRAVVLEDKKSAPYIDHSTAGAKYLFENFYTEQASPAKKVAIEWVCMAILSHHSGLHDFLSLNYTVSSFHRRIVEKRYLIMKKW